MLELTKEDMFRLFGKQNPDIPLEDQIDEFEFPIEPEENDDEDN